MTSATTSIAPESVAISHTIGELDVAAGSMGRAAESQSCLSMLPSNLAVYRRFVSLVGQSRSQIKHRIGGRGKRLRDAAADPARYPCSKSRANSQTAKSLARARQRAPSLRMREHACPNSEQLARRVLAAVRAALLIGLAWHPGAVSADEIRIAVAANFANAMAALVARFEAATDHVVLVSTGSTGAHYAQILNGAPFDAAFAADSRRPALLEQKGLAVAGTRFTYARGRLALWSPRAELVDTEGGVLSSGRFRHLAIANPALAPYGMAAREVLESLGLWERLQSRIVRGQDIGQTFGFVYSQNAELGFVAYSQIAGPDRPVEGSHWLVPEALHRPIEQQAVLLKDVPTARAFLEFVKGLEGRHIIASYGYGHE
jgi:molybdate transport system substrate-binding protein